VKLRRVGIDGLGTTRTRVRICTRGCPQNHPEDTEKSLSPLARPETAIALEAQIDPWSAHIVPTAVQFSETTVIDMPDFTSNCRTWLPITAVGLAVTTMVSDWPVDGGVVSLDIPFYRSPSRKLVRRFLERRLN
jgi:hypothetical protein